MTTAKKLKDFVRRWSVKSGRTLCSISDPEGRIDLTTDDIMSILQEHRQFHDDLMDIRHPQYCLMTTSAHLSPSDLGYFEDGQWRPKTYEDLLQEIIRLRCQKHWKTWRPIDTAPRDGSFVFVGRDQATVWIVHRAFYDEGELWETQGFSSQEEAAGWWSYTTNCVSQEKINPTHWMPEIPPPTETS